MTLRFKAEKIAVAVAAEDQKSLAAADDVNAVIGPSAASRGLAPNTVLEWHLNNG